MKTKKGIDCKVGAKMEQSLKGTWTSFCVSPRIYSRLLVLSGHVETVVLLSQQKPDDVIEVEIELDELDLTSAESKATYKEIQEYVLKVHGLKVSNLYISQVKRKCGIEVGENYNLPKSENSRQPQCPAEKEKAIRDALEHFGMV